jgi:hypothetical protein
LRRRRGRLWPTCPHVEFEVDIATLLLDDELFIGEAVLYPELSRIGATAKQVSKLSELLLDRPKLRDCAIDLALADNGDVVVSPGQTHRRRGHGQDQPAATASSREAEPYTNTPQTHKPLDRPDPTARVCYAGDVYITGLLAKSNPNLGCRP